MFWKLGLEHIFSRGRNLTHYRWLQPRVLPVFLGCGMHLGDFYYSPVKPCGRGRKQPGEGPQQEEGELNFAPVVPGTERAKGKSQPDP